MALASGHEARPVEGEELERLMKNFPTFKNGIVRLNPGGWLFPKRFLEYADTLYNFQVKPSDVYVLTYMKVGTTWTQEIIWTMKYNPNLDNPEAVEPIMERSPFIDSDMFLPEDVSPEIIEASKPMFKGFLKHCPEGDPRKGLNWQLGAAIPEPRVLKSHLPLSLLPPTLLDTAKVIYVARKPSDVICSYYHHCRLFKLMKFFGTLEEFCEFFLSDNLIYSPYWLHVKEAWEKRQHPNMLILLFEDMKKDIMKELKKLNDFLGTQLTDKQLENIAKYTSFSEMQKRDNLFGVEKNASSSAFVDEEVKRIEGGFFRKGKTGTGKEKIGPEMMSKVDEWTSKHFQFGLNFE